MSFHWAFDEDGGAQPVEMLKGGMVLVRGCEAPIEATHFVYINPEPLIAPGPNTSISWKFLIAAWAIIVTIGTIVMLAKP